MKFSNLERNQVVGKLQSKTYDVLVIGGELRGQGLR